MSHTAAKADEWIPVRPGTEGLVALAIGKLLAEAKGGAVPQAFATVDLKKHRLGADVSLETLENIVQHIVEFSQSNRYPGGSVLGSQQWSANC